MGSVEAVDGAAFNEEFEGCRLPNAALFEQALFAEIVLVAAGFPAVHHVRIDCFALLAKARDDVCVFNRVLHHFVNATPGGLWKASDGASALAGGAFRGAFG